MAKRKTSYECQSCGYRSPQWMGKCPDCGAWNSLLEVAAEERPAAMAKRSALPEATPLTQTTAEANLRLDTGIGELNRVLGGGLVPGELVLLAGDPGIGKSTLTLQLLASLAVEGPLLYVSGEESKAQIQNRAQRLGTLRESVQLVTENDMELLDALVAKMKPSFLVIDSVQTVFDPSLSGAPGTVTQLRQIAARAMAWSKGMGIPTLLIGHVTKDGGVAGPRVLEHMVDAVLFFEGERGSQYRILRSFKNRFGSTNEIGLFDMQGAGLVEVANPSEAFLAERPDRAPGSAVVAVMEGSRPILVECQALVAPTVFGQPRRMTNGADYNRVLMLLAILEKRLGLPLGNQDVYINIVGGLDVKEPAADMAIALAIASAVRGEPLPEDLIVVGEVGLTGELRRVGQAERRLKEAERLGFRRAVVPPGTKADLATLSLRPASSLGAVVNELWGNL